MLLFRRARRTIPSHVRPGSAMVLDVAHASLQLGLLWVLWRLRLLSVEGTYFVMGAMAGLVSLAWFFRERARVAHRARMDPRPLAAQLAACPLGSPAISSAP